jgi:PRD domain-containing protein
MSLDKPIEWGKNLVSLVLLIAIAEQDISVFKDSLIALYSVIENQNLMSELMLMSDGKKIKNKILEEVSQNAR